LAARLVGDAKAIRPQITPIKPPPHVPTRKISAARRAGPLIGEWAEYARGIATIAAHAATTEQVHEVVHSDSPGFSRGRADVDS
jgi:hypothetical protein